MWISKHMIGERLGSIWDGELKIVGGNIRQWRVQDTFLYPFSFISFFSFDYNF